METSVNTEPKSENLSEGNKELESSTSTKKLQETKLQNDEPKNKKRRKHRENAIIKIMETEVACRKQLHAAQMANERQKFKNLLMEEELLKLKFEYLQNKLN